MRKPPKLRHLRRARILVPLAALGVVAIVATVAAVRSGDGDRDTAAPPTSVPGDTVASPDPSSTAPPDTPVPTSTAAPPSTTPPLAPIPPLGEGPVHREHGYEWRPVTIGGGGNISGIDIADDGTVVARVDVYGAYILSPSADRWRQLLTTEALPAGWRQPKLGKGVQEIAISPSDSSTVYVQWAGHLFRTADGGRSWTQTNFPPTDWDANGPLGRGAGGKMAVDPVNPNVVFAGTPNNPLQLSTDGGATWTTANVPAGRPVPDLGPSIRSIGITGIVFDRSAGAASGRSNRAYAASWGNGVYRTNDGGRTWSLLANSPKFVLHASIDRSGALFAVEGTGPTSIWRYQSGSWRNVTPGGWPKDALASVEHPFIAANPSTDGHVIAGYTSHMFVTATGGSAWEPMTWSDIGGDVTWDSSRTPNYYLVASDLQFSPATPNRIWLATGSGTQFADLAGPSATSVAWQKRIRGQETMVATDVDAAKGGPPIFGLFDWGKFSGSDLSTFALSKSPADQFAGTTSVAASPFVDGYACAATTDYIDRSGDGVSGPPFYSGCTIDGGRTWTVFPTLPRGKSGAEFGYGDLAVSGNGNIVWAPGRYYSSDLGGGFQPYYTTDGAKTWHPVVLPGVASYPEDSVSGFMFTKNRHVIVADELTEGTFYLVLADGRDNRGRSVSGVYKSTDGGASWQVLTSGNFSGGNLTAEGELRAQIGSHALYWNDGQFGGHNWRGASEYNSGKFVRLLPGATQWSEVTTISGVLAFGIGAPPPGGSIGTIYAAGTVRGTYGIWRSTDDAATWTQIGDYPFTVDSVRVVNGDRNRFGRVYIGFNGTSYVYGDPAR